MNKRRRSSKMKNSKVTYNRKKTTNKSRSRRNSKSRYIKSKGNKKYILCIVIFILIIISLYKIMPDAIYIKTGLDEYDDERIKELIREVLEENEELSQQEAEEIVMDQIGQTEEIQVTSRGATVSSRSGNTINKTTSLGEFRITSYHPGDGCASGTKTGSGLTVKDFSTMKIGNKDVYTYKGKIVVACATEELLASGYNVKGAGTRQEGKYYFNYYDTGKLNIDGTWYDFIVLDSCGAASWIGERRVDIYVPSASDIINRSSVEVVI